MKVVLKNASKYLSPHNKLYINGKRYGITEDEWNLIPERDKELFETEEKITETKKNKQKKK